jgi:Concanavalin A-like lectin/glucanases superfamily/Bacterial Ig-like domain/GEVED domain/Cadherin-like domain/Bacterial Ig domain
MKNPNKIFKIMFFLMLLLIILPAKEIYAQYCASSSASQAIYNNQIWFPITGDPFAGGITTGSSAYHDGSASGSVKTFSRTTSSENKVNYGIDFTGASANKSYYHKVWIDGNQDNDFDDAGEEVISSNSTFPDFASGGLSSINNSGFAIPASFLGGNTRMRIIVKLDAAITSPCETGFTGETEDWLVTIPPGATIAPTISTVAASSIGATLATMGGNASADGGAAITEKGVVYSFSDTTPEIGDLGVTKNTNGTGTGSFSESIGSLTSETKYYFQAYATNSAGTTYGGVQIFTTADITAPTIISSSPLDNATGVSSSNNLTITFNENVAFGTGNIQIIDLDGGSGTVTIDVASPGLEASINNAVLTLNPSNNLKDLTNYAVQIAASAIDDVSGNSYAGITDNTTLNFTTINNAPTISDISKTISEDNNLTFNGTDFTSAYNDIDPLNKIQIKSLPSNGVLTNSGAVVSVDDEILAANIGNLVYIPRRNYNGSDSFNYNASDGTEYATSNKAVNITISAVDDAPVAGSGWALDFDGVNDMVDGGNHSSLQISGTNISLEASINASAWKTNVWEGSLISKEDSHVAKGYILRVGASGRINFVFGDNTTWHQLTTQPILNLNTWYHVVATYDGAYMRIYVDGIIIDSLAKTESIAITAANLRIGDSPFVNRNWQGKIDEVRIWNKALLNAEIKNNQYKILVGNESNLVAYYRFDEGSGLTALDATSNINDGALTNMDAGNDWVKSEAWKNRIIDEDATLVINPEGYDPDVTVGTGLSSSTQSVAPGNGALSFSPLTYTPTANYNGSDSFTYQVNSAVSGSDTYAVSVSVNAVNDPPTGTNKTLNPNENDALTIVKSDFGYSDIDSDSLNNVKILAKPASGSLWIDTDDSGTINNAEVAIDDNDIVIKADLDTDKLKYLPSGTTNSSFTFQVHDGTVYSITNTITLTVNAKPTVTINQSSGQSDPTNSTTINFTVEFSEAVTGFVTGCNAWRHSQGNNWHRNRKSA